MRVALMAVVAAVAMAIAGGCATEKARVEKEDKISAARLDGKFRHDDPIVQMLTEEQRSALDRQGMLAERTEGDELADADGSADDAGKSDMDTAGDVMMSVLTVGITLGMMAAPYLLF
jgi:hypothetical protein